MKAALSGPDSFWCTSLYERVGWVSATVLGYFGIDQLPAMGLETREGSLLICDHEPSVADDIGA